MCQPNWIEYEHLLPPLLTRVFGVGTLLLHSVSYKQCRMGCGLVEMVVSKKN